MTKENKIKNITDRYGLNIKVEELVSRVYRELRSQGENIYILNDKYLLFEGQEFSLRRNRKDNEWKVKAF